MSGEADAREAWLNAHAELSARAIEFKQSTEVLLALVTRYRRLAPDERSTIDQLLSEQVASEDKNIRFDALVVIGECEIISALPALRSLAERLETATGPGAPYEWAQVNRLIAFLTGPAGGNQ